MMESPGNNAIWGYSNPVRLRFGVGSRGVLIELLHGKRILAVSSARGRKQFSSDVVLAPIAKAAMWVDDVRSNPGLVETQEVIDRLCDQSFDAVLAIGGGSSMDAAKALAAALAPDVRSRDLRTLITDTAMHLGASVLPIYALPTTSGTGAEVTPFATIWDHANRKKLSLASPYLFPHTAVVDPELTYALPYEATISTALDALNQAFESVWNRHNSPMTIALAARAIRLALLSVPRLVENLDDHSARNMMSEASLLSGLCISQTRTALCHSISYPLTAHFGISHGLACAATMAAVARLTLAEQGAALEGVATMAGFGDAMALILALEDVLKVAGVQAAVLPMIPSLDAVLTLTGEMFTPGRSDNFIVDVTPEKLKRILAESFSSPLEGGSNG